MYNTLFKLNDYLENSVPSLNMFISIKVVKLKITTVQFQKNYFNLSI